MATVELQSLIGERGVDGLVGAIGEQGVAGLVGAIGPAGVAGLVGSIGPQGIQGLIGAVGLTGLTGLVGAIGPAGVAGLVGAIGPQGIQGLVGEIGLTGLTGLAGAIGPTGVAGLVGAVGPQGVAGLIGSMGVQGIQGIVGPQGVAGLAGVIGPIGLQGPPGPTGPAGGIDEYAYIFNNTPEVVALNAAVDFDANGPITAGITHAPGSSVITLTNAGTYEVTYSVSGVEPNQFTLFANGAPVVVSTYGSGAGTQQTFGHVILTVPAGTTLSLRNHLSAAAVTLQTLAGGTQPNVNASMIVRKIA